MKKRYVNALLLGMSLCVAAPGTAVSASEIPAQESAVEDTSDAELEAIMREAEAAAAGADGTEESGSDGSATEETKYAIRIPDPANYVLGFGIFRNRTVQQAFEEAKYNEASHATMDLYLHIDPATEKDPVKREGLYAIQQYLALYRSRGCQ